MIKRDPSREMHTMEALLFASGEPVALKDLAKGLGLEVKDVRILARLLTEEYDRQNSGMKISFLEQKLQMTSRPDYYSVIETLYTSRQQIRLTDTQLETLAIVAYRQPVTRQEISDIRGVSSDAVVSRLIGLGLVEEAGRLKAPGRPILLRTSDEFLRCFGLTSVKELPDLPPVRQEEKEEKPEEKEE